MKKDTKVSVKENVTVTIVKYGFYRVNSEGINIRKLWTNIKIEVIILLIVYKYYLLTILHF